eukprot:4082474-Heterocapsa_arctica.AAC.1
MLEASNERPGELYRELVQRALGARERTATSSTWNTQSGRTRVQRNQGRAASRWARQPTRDSPKRRTPLETNGGGRSTGMSTGAATGRARPLAGDA